MARLQVLIHHAEILPLEQSPSSAGPIVIRALLEEMLGRAVPNDVGHGVLQALPAPWAQPTTAFANSPASILLFALRISANGGSAGAPETRHAQR